MTLADASLTTVSIVFGVTALVIAVVGTLLTRFADDIADRTGAGEAMTGGILLGAATSLGGTVTSVSTAWAGDTDLAISNAVGGIAAQTAFLAVGDLMLRRVNLEHGAAAIENLFQGVLLVVLLSIPLIAHALPALTIWQVDVTSVVLVLAYVYANKKIDAARRSPMWQAFKTRDTQDEAAEAEDQPDGGIRLLLLGFLATAVITGLCGYVLGRAGTQIAAMTGLTQSFVGALMTAVVTSVPELVTTIAAVRRGALNLAVGGIIGGNAFDVLFLALADVAYRDGSIYQAFQPEHQLIVAGSILMSGVLLLGLLKRDPEGPAGIGFESVILLLGYAGIAAAVSFVN
jgi:cation:H+ antiporter